MGKPPKLKNKKSFHPRNIYQQKLDFKQMAIDYPEFRKIAKQDISGHITIDFKDEESLRILNKTLLKKDFDLDVNIPPGYLVPTISLRINYILWIEDILGLTKSSNHIFGIDIGTGASCVYMLLGARKNKWHMIGTDIDDESIKFAQENICNNNLQHLLEAIKTTENEPIFSFLSNQTQNYDFCMCNPPFFSNLDEISKKNDRTLNRLAPWNVATGKPSEVATKGGEEEFVSRIINESAKLKTKVRVYTSMVGQKKTLHPLTELIKIIGAKSYMTTEFFQGHTMRWGLAWTFCNDINLQNLKDKPIKEKSKKEMKPIINLFSSLDKFTTVDELVNNKLKEMFDYLKFKYTQNIESNIYVFEISAYENTWIHQRRKRREEKYKTNINIQTVDKQNNDVIADKISNENNVQEISTDKGIKKRFAEENLENSDKKKLKWCPLTEPILKFNLVIEKINMNQYQFTMMYIGGTESKDLLYQVMTYFKNNLK